MDDILQHSNLYKLLIEINDKEVVKQELAKKIRDENFSEKQIVDIVINYDINYLLLNPTLWHILFYFQFVNIVEIKEKYVLGVYRNLNYDIDFDNNDISSEVKKFLTEKTCINARKKCEGY